MSMTSTDIQPITTGEDYIESLRGRKLEGLFVR